MKHRTDSTGLPGEFLMEIVEHPYGKFLSKNSWKFLKKISMGENSANLKGQIPFMIDHLLHLPIAEKNQLQWPKTNR